MIKNAYLLLMLIVLFFGQNMNAQSIINKTLHFNVDEYSLTASSQEILLELTHQLEDSNESALQIVGHTDQNGSLEYNMKLSKNRAEAVKNFMLENGYVGDEIQISFQGESNLLAKGVDQESMKLNRRVTVKAIIYNYETVNDFVSQLTLDIPDSVLVDQNEEQEINLSKGTLVKLPSHAFCNIDGSPLLHDEVEMVFKEAFDYTKMFDERLATQTADQMLETGGMIYIEATQDGIPLRLKEGKEIELIFPEQELKEGMELFTGVETEQGIIWEETGEKIQEEKEEFFVKVDLSPITSFSFEYADTLAMPDQPMPRYPSNMHKPQPPAKIKYSEEKYQELYTKYEDALVDYYIQADSLPIKLKTWHSEVYRRKKLLADHKRLHVSSFVKSWMAFHINKIKERSQTISHDKMLRGLELFLNRKVGDAQYDYLKYRNLVFGGALNDVLDHYELPTYDYSKDVMGDYCYEIYPALEKVNNSIIDKKIEMGYVDVDVSRYVVQTSDLGWINCDRFLKLADEEKMDLHFAHADREEGLDYYLIFKDIKSIIRPRIVNGEIVFNNVPKGRDVKLVSLEVKNDQCYLAAQDIKLSEGVKIDLQYQKSSLAEVRNTLESI